MEESRWGEVEVWGEVEFFRGEVECGCLEFRWECEKVVVVFKYIESGRNLINFKEMEEKDDEIKNFKVMFNCVSVDINVSGVNGLLYVDLEEFKKL